MEMSRINPAVMHFFAGATVSVAIAQLIDGPDNWYECVSAFFMVGAATAAFVVSGFIEKKNRTMSIMMGMKIDDNRKRDGGDYNPLSKKEYEDIERTVWLCDETGDDEFGPMQTMWVFSLCFFLAIVFGVLAVVKHAEPGGCTGICI